MTRNGYEIRVLVLDFLHCQDRIQTEGIIGRDLD